MAKRGLPPWMLRLGGVLFISLPFAGFFTGVYSQPGVKKFAVVAQAVVYVLFGVTAFQLAKSREQAKAGMQAMRSMREKLLATAPGEWGINPTKEYPRIYGILMEFPVKKDTATVWASCLGDASLYTSSAFGVVGGIKHEPVREAAKRFVKLAETYHEVSAPTADRSYPRGNQVRFYFLTFQGARAIDTDMDSVAQEQNRYHSLFASGQAVLTELRLIAQKKAP